MKSAQAQMKSGRVSEADKKALQDLKPDLLIAFGSIGMMRSPDFQAFAAEFKAAPVIGCSTAGEVSKKGFFENTVVINAIRFDQAGSRVRVAHASAFETKAGEACGAGLAKQLLFDDLAGVMLLAPGVGVNPPAIIHGLKSELDSGTIVFGGLAGDGAEFKETGVFYDGEFRLGACLAIGFYGSELKIRHSAKGGWQTFGGVREITKAEENIVYEIDGRPALDVYKEALGEHARELPKNGLSFPLSIVNGSGDDIGLMRAVLTVDEGAKSLLLAGDVNLRRRESSRTFVRFARGNNRNLIEGAKLAAEELHAVPDSSNRAEDSFGIIISCVARKLVMGAAIDDEVDAVAQELGNCSHVSGFYAYGEIGPFFTKDDCQLHNQTVTIAVLSEKRAA